MIIVGRPPLSVGTYGSISIAPYGTGYRARTLYRDYDGVTRRVERHGQTKGAAERARDWLCAIGCTSEQKRRSHLTP
jgi:hypothetical protein